MSFCYDCGEEIEFRYIDGRPTPIHLHGGWCSASNGSSNPKPSKPFQSRESYTNPNAHCPVCGERVFFYQSPAGGRVFFDDLGWPWPKHPCTDNPKAQKARVKTIKTSHGKPFLSKNGYALAIYNLEEFLDKEGKIFLKLKKSDYPFSKISVIVYRKSLDKANIRISDIKDAPSFVVRPDGDFWIISFMSVRRKKIITMRLRKG